MADAPNRLAEESNQVQYLRSIRKTDKKELDHEAHGSI